MKLFLYVGLLCLALHDLALGMPRDLVKVANTVGCSPIKDFYERDGEIAPDFINAQDGRQKIIEQSYQAAFWCKPKKKTEIYWLVFTIDGVAQHRDGCPAILEWKERPKGLSIHWTKPSLTEFLNMRNKKPLVGVSGDAGYRTLVDSYDGSGFSFYCRDKQWYVLPLH